ncbi:two-component system LytT family sensor kinase [Rhodococcus sp. LBL1]|uniref:Two-component system LytT family sensor kinase n=2 Tax=Prescottella agglutinans TaxID=1644129 RepID=A0ABT6MC04_9NOCA|nr:two-component system LytT family sensor kinase [Prescottella agglutinans]MDH6676406.1 two-component system LytT family sensor kinase [Rhodococcus sp. LBL1]MDH6681692.1 two-component system LytT family sensor kinase [Rhodococcus sp. LBL2]
MSVVLWTALVVVVAVLATVVAMRTRRVLTTPAERAVHDTLHTASLAAGPLRRGLDEASSREAAPHLRRLTGAESLAIAGPDGALLAWNGPHEALSDQFVAAAARAIAGGRRVLVGHGDLARASGDHDVRAVVAQPLLIEHTGVVGVLGVVTTAEPGPAMLGALTEVARYACSQIELAELDASRARLDRAEVRALRAQISPHFIYNALGTIASFVRTDPDRARELVLEFADFTRYSFRSAGEYTVLADELRNIDRYLTLERARFGDNLEVRLQIAPEVLSVVLPFLALQPLVENAVRHGLSGKRDGGTVTIVASDAGPDCIISVEDDGVGMDPELLRSGELDAVTSGTGGPSTSEAAHVGLANVDDRLRAAFGNDYGLVVETAPGAGTKVSMRVPKFRPGIRA